MDNQRSTLTAATLLKYLQEHSDIKHPLTTKELQEVLRNGGYLSDRRTVTTHFRQLMEAGFPIGLKKRGKANCYFWEGFPWEPEEIQILTDAVTTAAFLTPDQKKKMIAKLKKLAPAYIRDQLMPEIQVTNDRKAPDDDNLRKIRTIRKAMEQDCRISFGFVSQNDGEEKKTETQEKRGERVIVSPYELIQKDGTIYMICCQKGQEEIFFCPVDRMKRVFVLTDQRQPDPRY